MLARVLRRAEERGVAVLAYDVRWEVGATGPAPSLCDSLAAPGGPGARAWPARLVTELPPSVRRRPPTANFLTQHFAHHHPPSPTQGGRASWGRRLPVVYGAGVAAANVDEEHLARVLEFNATDPRTHWKSPKKQKAASASGGSDKVAKGAAAGGKRAAAKAAGGGGGRGKAAAAAIEAAADSHGGCAAAEAEVVPGGRKRGRAARGGDSGGSGAAAEAEDAAAPPPTEPVSTGRRARARRAA
jgi:hypothetical protein